MLTNPADITAKKDKNIKNLRNKIAELQKNIKALQRENGSLKERVDSLTKKKRKPQAPPKVETVAETSKEATNGSTTTAN